MLRSRALWHLNIDNSHPYTNKARTAYVMLARASTTSLTCAQSSTLLSDAGVDSKVEVLTRRLGCVVDTTLC